MDGDWPRIAGYEVLDEIGRGGMGIVYQARRRDDGVVRALKMMLRGRGATLGALARFRIEAEALACLRHPNIIKIRDVGVHEGYPFFAMDFAEGGNLRQVTARGPQDPSWSAALVRTLAQALQHAHERGMLHRDLKPANILLRQDGAPIVSDFGLVKFAVPVEDVSQIHCTFSVSLLDMELARFAREFSAQYHADNDSAATTDGAALAAWESCAARTGLLDDDGRLKSIREFLDQAEAEGRNGSPGPLDDLTRTGAVMGSPGYMAPEQATGDLDRIGPGTDIHALGIILYELLVARPPFRGDNPLGVIGLTIATPPTPPSRLVSDLPPFLEAICLKCLEKSPDRRYHSAAALADDLSRFLDGAEPLAFADVNRATAVFPDSPGSTSRSWATTAPPNAAPTPTSSWWPFGRRRRS